MKRILHITFDFPDYYNNQKMKALQKLLKALSGQMHYVFSLNRTSNILEEDINLKSDICALKIFGLPYGFFLPFFMKRTAKKISQIIKKKDLNFDIIHGHKLTFEGIICQELSVIFKKPYILSIRGDTDIKVLKFKPYLKSLYNSILKNASRIFFVSPWTKKEMKKILKKEHFKKSLLLPNIVEFSGTPIPNENPMDFVTVFQFKSYKRKNIEKIIRAFDQLNKNGIDVGLDIIGYGNKKKNIESIIKKTSVPNKFRLLGKIKNQDLANYYPNYLGFVLPSYPETFGLVYIEALLCGIPVIFSKNAGIDGYFKEKTVGVSVCHKSVDNIAIAIKDLIENNHIYRHNIQKLIKSGKLDFFSKKHVKNLYEMALENI